MGLTINMCNDVEKYEESVIGGFNVKKVLYILIALFAGGATMAFFAFVLHVHIIVSVYLMIPVIVPIIMKGFYGNGKTSWIKGILAVLKKKKPLTYRSTETTLKIAAIEKEDDTDGKKRTARKRFRHR